MAHDKNTIHVSHYKDSPTWRSAVAPEDRSWLLFVDVTGAPHLYLATETRDAEGQTVTTYAPCVRAMLRSAAEAGTPMLPGVEAASIFAITVGPNDAPDHGEHPFRARSGERSRSGATARAAVLGLLAELPDVDDPLRDPSVAVLAL